MWWLPASLAGGLTLALVALAVCGLALRRAQAQLTQCQARVDLLEADLSAALRPPPPRTPAERVVRGVVRTAGRTAGRVREQGWSGLVASSLDDLQAWAASERSEITSMASADGVVTVMFSDIEDSTARNSATGDDAWVRTLAAHNALVRGRVETYRGQVVKTQGDGFMVAFRDAEAACRAATGIQRDLRRSIDPRLRGIRVRIGIHTGQVVSRDGDYFGRNVTTAARVCDLADGGEVLVTDALRLALDDDAAVTLAPYGDHQLKGLPGSELVWRATP